MGGEKLKPDLFGLVDGSRVNRDGSGLMGGGAMATPNLAKK